MMMVRPHFQCVRVVAATMIVAANKMRTIAVA
jgi:hypothetical protein